MPLDPPGSVWVECDPAGNAKCPHCGAVGWYREHRWAACKHAVGPGSVGDKPALIFRGQKCESK
jgi:hypothetical protein